MTKKDDHNRPPKVIERSESIDASTREVSGSRIKGLEAENRKLTIQRMFREQLRSLEKEEAVNERRGLSPSSESSSN